MDSENYAVTVNLKMNREMRNKFKSAAKTNGTTMQAVLYSMAENYIENSDHMRVRVVDTRHRDG